MQCLVPDSSIYISSPEPESTAVDILMTVNGLTKSDVDILASHCSAVSYKQSDHDTFTLHMTNGQKAQQTVKIVDSKCAAKMLQYVATNRIRFDLRPNAKWLPLRPSDPNIPFGTCQTTFPPRPAEHWVKCEERNQWYRMHDPAESRAFHNKLENRPRAFQTVLDKTVRTLTVKTFPEVVAHYAAGYLAQDRGLGASDGIKVSFRLSASQFQTDPVLEAFRVPSCNSEEKSNIALNPPYKLYERQQKVVTKMLSIENRKTLFCETEMYEEYMPGSTGWSLIAKAERNVAITGGVVADAIG
jgi:hypothetical protein